MCECLSFLRTFLALFHPVDTEKNTAGPHFRLVKFFSGNGLVLSGNKPLHELTLTKYYDTTLHQGLMSYSNLVSHCDAIKWKHFPRYWSLVRGIHRSPVNSPHKGQWRGALIFSLICALNKRLSKQSRGWWFETPSRSLWRRCNAS